MFFLTSFRRLFISLFDFSFVVFTVSYCIFIELLVFLNFLLYENLFFLWELPFHLHLILYFLSSFPLYPLQYPLYVSISCCFLFFCCIILSLTLLNLRERSKYFSVMNFSLKLYVFSYIYPFFFSYF